MQHNTKFFVIFKYDYESDLAACNQWNSFAGKVWVRRSVSVGTYFFTGRLSENSLGKFLKRFKSLEILKAFEGGKICIFAFSILQRQKRYMCLSIFGHCIVLPSSNFSNVKMLDILKI